MSTRDRFKQRFNFEFRNKDKEIQARNYSIFWAAIKNIIILILIMTPIFVYTYILYHNINSIRYVEYRYDGKPIWDYLTLPNGNQFKSLLWSGYAFFFIDIIALFFLKSFVTGKNTRLQKFFFIYSVALIGFISIFLFALSQYQYSRFHDFYVYEALTMNDSKFEFVQDLNEFYASNYLDQKSFYNWESTVVVWWVMIGQLIVIFACAIMLQNAIFGKTIDSDVDYKAKITNEDSLPIGNKLARSFAKIFRNTDKNIAAFVLIATLIIIIPNLVYSILSTTRGTNLTALITWSYKMPRYLADLKDGTSVVAIDELASLYYGHLFLIASLPLISMGLTIASLFFFFAILVRGESISNKIFIFEISTLFVEVLLMITFMLVSKIYMSRLEDYWNYKLASGTRAFEFFEDLKKILNNNERKDDVFTSLTNSFKTGKMMNKDGFNIEWFNRYGIIAEGIISYAFLFGTYSISGYDIYKLTRSEQN
ncbi:hypothetical protein [Mesoplasma lactucae]|uniref:Uncharacterized protein n=1 Tax=Mesoplasma lactucae ATCC 49193 TaxID=81460 RepID=A0A291ISQ0_9MOLU|nr:hypothetical protein [Mesoplasma lactucae]ATG97764.1 hypothetical protein CP520_03440 [Mesoplasma lactucae ATCC 49193]ATZ20459.1 hypothetical protein MLACT_v1c06380 [Mesoplasma lactucae ATCC 49193]MCL8216631.1 hypothetical protein [Mesoplasma lactucae ATCC 49193]